MLATRTPLVSLSLETLSAATHPFLSRSTKVVDEQERGKKPWHHYLPLCVTIFLILAPHPSLLYVLVDFHLHTLHRPLLFLTHLLITYTLTFLALSSLIVCVARDPGPVNYDPSAGENPGGNGAEEVGLAEALMPDDDFSTPGKWCHKCWAPKPERTHHCSYCGRCVLKMGEKIIIAHGWELAVLTYPAFLHFLCSVTLLATYIAIMSTSALVYAFNNPYAMNETTPLHELGLAAAGYIFSLVIGSFFGYHLYLVTTNQTTLENISPFLLLRHLPALPPAGHGLSDPPLEAELSSPQRRLVKDAHEQIRLYDVGWRKNWAQVLGWSHRFGWLHRLWCGGASPGDGKSFPRNPRSDEMLARLATELVKLDRNS